jgi:hypothetical protein
MASAHVARFRAVAGEMTEYWQIFKGHLVRPGS